MDEDIFQGTKGKWLAKTIEATNVVKYSLPASVMLMSDLLHRIMVETVLCHPSPVFTHPSYSVPRTFRTVAFCVRSYGVIKDTVKPCKQEHTVLKNRLARLL